jgi:hypothetical protein
MPTFPGEGLPALDARSLLVGTALMAFWALPGVLAFRLLPFVGFVAISRTGPWFVRVGVVALYIVIAVIALRAGSTPTYWLLLAYLYFAGAGWAAFELWSSWRSPIAVALSVVLLFWILPIAAIQPMPPTFLTLAWELALAAYSYQRDTVREPRRSLKGFLFFLLVNPALVYKNSGIRVERPSLNGPGLARIALGIVAVFVSFALLGVKAVLVVSQGSLNASGFEGASLLLLVGMLRLTSEYAAHSGVASIQIGFMRQLGYRVPERYRYPLFARSPADFWRRWNTYVGDWAERYLFSPLALALRRRSKGLRWASAGTYAIAIVVTFAIIGLLHDFAVMARERQLIAPATKWFFVVGCLVVLWEASIGAFKRSNAARWRAYAERTLLLGAACYAAAHLWS